MIFVTVGTNEAPFDRLLAAVDGLEVEETTVVQCGSSALRPAGCECVEFMSFDQIVEHVRAARVVVTHAGVGSVLVALANGKRPIVVPRLAAHGEAVDDHQLAFARRFASEGQVRLVDELDRLRGVLREEGTHTVERRPGPGDGGLAADIRRYIDAELGSSMQRRPAAGSR